MSTLDAVHIYACGLLGALLVLPLCHHAIRLVRSWTSTLRPYTLRFLQLPLAVNRHKFIGPVSRGSFLSIAIFIGGVIVANAVGITNTRAAGVRTGTLCVINMVPLFLTTQFGFAADMLGVSLDRARAIHRALGAVCFFEGLFHVIFSAPGTSARGQLGIFGILGAISIGLLAILPIFQNVAYELFLVSHVLTAAFLAVSIWLHLSLKDSKSRYFVMGAAGMLVATSLQRLLRILLHNTAFRRGDRPSRFTRIKADEHENGLVKVTISLPTAWKIRAGQHVYIQVPFLNLNSWIQSHPFMIISWSMSEGTAGAEGAMHQSKNSDKATSLTLIISPKLGWTSILLPSLKRLGDGSTRGTIAFVDGPYGGLTDVGDFGTVLMIATGMGIFAHIPYINGLLNGYDSATVRTQKIRVVWQADQKSVVHAKEWMDRFLARDQETLSLDISLYYPDKGEGSGEMLGQRLRTFRGRMNCHTMVSEELARMRGGLLVSVSAESAVRDAIRGSMAKRSAAELKGVKLAELDFQPRDGGRHTSTIA